MRTLDIQQRPSLRAVVGLLSSAKLPACDLMEDHLAHFFYSGPETDPTRLGRDKAPFEIKAAREFPDICPASAVFLTKSLQEKFP